MAYTLLWMNPYVHRHAMLFSSLHNPMVPYPFLNEDRILVCILSHLDVDFSFESSKFESISEIDTHHKEFGIMADP
jgi:hypothetical protein